MAVKQIILTQDGLDALEKELDICNALESDDIDDLGFPVDGFNCYVIGYFCPQKPYRSWSKNNQNFWRKRTKHNINI